MDFQRVNAQDVGLPSIDSERPALRTPRIRGPRDMNPPGPPFPGVGSSSAGSDFFDAVRSFDGGPGVSARQIQVAGTLKKKYGGGRLTRPHGSSTNPFGG